MSMEAVALDMGYAAVRRRLMKPPNGRDSSELDIATEPALRRRRIAEEAKRLLILQERRERLFDALVETHKRTGRELTKLPNDGLRAVTLIQITRTVCQYFATPRAILFSIRRRAELVRPRHILMYLAMELTELSFPQVARFMAGRDHTTILHGHRKISQTLAAGHDEKLAADIAEIKKLLGVE